jgi:hypothetical protein
MKIGSEAHKEIPHSHATKTPLSYGQITHAASHA